VLQYRESDIESSDESENMELFDSDDENSKRLTCGVTKKIKKTPHRKKKYKIIPDSLREKLIEAVQNRGEKIKQAAKKLRINYSSAKSICQIFKKEGRSSKKTFKKRSPGDPEDDSSSPESDSTSRDQIIVKTDSHAESEMKIEPTPAPVQEKQKAVEKEDLVLRDQILQKLSYFETQNYSALDPKAAKPLDQNPIQQKQIQIQNHNNSHLKPNSSFSLGKEQLLKNEAMKMSKLDNKYSNETSFLNMKQALPQLKLPNPQINPQLLQLMNSSYLPQLNFDNSLSQLQSNLLSMSNHNPMQSMLLNLNPQDFLMTDNYSNLQQNLNFMYSNNRQNQHSTVPDSQYPFNHLHNMQNSAVNNGYLHQMYSLHALGKLLPQLHEKQKENLKSQTHQF